MSHNNTQIESSPVPFPGLPKAQHNFDDKLFQLPKLYVSPILSPSKVEKVVAMVENAKTLTVEGQVYNTNRMAWMPCTLMVGMAIPMIGVAVDAPYKATLFSYCGTKTFQYMKRQLTDRALVWAEKNAIPSNKKEPRRYRKVVMEDCPGWMSDLYADYAPGGSMYRCAPVPYTIESEWREKWEKNIRRNRAPWSNQRNKRDAYDEHVSWDYTGKKYKAHEVVHHHKARWMGGHASRHSDRACDREGYQWAADHSDWFPAIAAEQDLEDYWLEVEEEHEEARQKREAYEWVIRNVAKAQWEAYWNGGNTKTDTEGEWINGRYCVGADI